MNKSRNRLARKGSGYAHNSQQGLTLIEILTAMAILSAVAVVFLMGMSTSSRAVMVSQERVTVDNLAKSQMEIIKSCEYDEVHDPPDYSASKLADIPTGYDITINAERMDPVGDGFDTDDGMQRITVTITHDGETALTMVGYKVN